MSLNIIIYDTKNHFFYCSHSLLEEDFLNLSSQQGLLADFSSVPTNLARPGLAGA